MIEVAQGTFELVREHVGIAVHIPQGISHLSDGKWRGAKWIFVTGQFGDSG